MHPPQPAPRRLDHPPEDGFEDAVTARPRQHEEHGLANVVRGHHPPQLAHVRSPTATHGEIGRDAAGADIRAADIVRTRVCGSPGRETDAG
jgi:hypothetical protein